MSDRFGSGHVARTRALLSIGAAAVLISGAVHLWLYFHGGYRGIAPDAVLGITVSRAFVLQAIAAVVVAEALVLATRRPGWELPAAAAGIAFGAGSVVAYVASRTGGLLGFEESVTSVKAIVALVAEGVAVAALLPVAAAALRRSRRAVRAAS